MKKLILNIPLGLFLLLLLIHCQFKQEKSPYTKLGSKLEKARSILNFGKEWKFYLGDALGADASGFDDSMWRKLNLPHDWSIEGEFSDKHPASPGGGALPGGIGWILTAFTRTAKCGSMVIP